jgi:hypothetical protein
MLKPTTTTLKHLASRLDEQSLEIATLRLALADQVQRIVQMQAELDLWLHSPGLRRAIRTLSAEPPSGNARIAAMHSAA